MNMIENNTAAVPANIKNVEIVLNFKSGQKPTALVAVDKNKYASFQSKACTYKQKLICSVALKKVSTDEAKNLWKTNVVDKWNDLVKPSYEALFPQSVRNEIDEIRPAAAVLEFEVTE